MIKACSQQAPSQLTPVCLQTDA